MAESALRFHPIDPAATIDADDVAAIVARVEEAFPDATDIAVQRWPTVQFVDNGANLDRVLCPSCGDDLTEAWPDLMEAAWSRDGFDDLTITTPCCSTPTSLDRLAYDWPAGFGRFSVDVREPGSTWFTPRRDVPDAAVSLLADLIRLTGHRLGVVWRHL